jgi:hypothetical protein
MNRIQRSLPLTLLALAACMPPHAASVAPNQTPESALADLEERLLTAPTLHLRYRVQAAGAFSADLDGELRLEGSDVVQLMASGTFGATPVQLHLHAADGHMRGGSGAQSFEGAVPDHLRSALVLGLTRMGILHNLSRLSRGLAPDHAAGGVREWVVARDVTLLDQSEGGSGSTPGLHFSIEVAGMPAAEASLWTNHEGWPLRRTQTMRFPGGEVLVTEEYEVVG